MAARFAHKKFIINWLKALMLSPGMLFPAGYLLVYLSINIYLNADFKQNLAQSISKATGNTWQISIKSLKSGLVLNSVTLNQIELTPVASTEISRQKSNHAITINTLEIPCPKLEKLLFSSKERLASTKTVCDKILADERLIQ
ncbi:MAG: hypothetical protein WCI01_09265 [Chlorobiaceae bacterium]